MKNRDSYVLENMEVFDEEQQKIDDLLYEAVDRGMVSTVTMLLDVTGRKGFVGKQSADKRIICNPNDLSSSICMKWKERTNVRGTILAAQRGNYALIKVFLSRGFDIAKPHGIMCKCWLCKDDALVRTKTRIAIYTALCNPIWMSLTSKDPFTAAFTMSHALERLEKIEDAYENVFTILKTQVQTYCMDLLDCVERSSEQYTIVNMFEFDEYTDEDGVNEKSSLNLIKLAFKYKLKKIVAHPVIQHVITSLVFDNIPRWRNGGSMYRFSYIIMKSLLFPITAMAYLFLPCSSVGKSSQEPLIKFINGASSFVTFLALIAALPVSGLRIGNTPSSLEWVILIWLLSLLVAEINQLSQVGWRRYLSSGWNLLDIAMIFLMLTSFCIWTILYFLATLVNESSIGTTRSIANGLFTCGTVMSFFRLVYLCQIARFLGLLQLCLGKMIEVIFQFAFISCVVLWSFSVGLVFLHNSLHVDDIIGNHSDMANKSEVQVVLSKSFAGLPATMVTLAWASLNMVGLSSLKDFDDGGIVYLWSAFLFTLYYGVAMIVLLNMLIAMMSNSYQQIENNIEVEHKFAKTQLLVDYIVYKNFLPCPFNLIPTWQFIKTTFERIRNKNKGKSKPNLPGHQPESPTGYEKVTRELVKRYLKKKYHIDLGHENDTRNIVNSEENSAFEAQVKRFIDQLRRKVRGLSKNMRSFEDSGLDVSFNGEQSKETSETRFKL